MPKSIKAYKGITGPIGWYSGGSPEFHTLHNRGVVETTSGPMHKVQIESCSQTKSTIYSPSSDVIARVGWAKITRNSGGFRPAGLSPGIWYWDGKFYAMAVDGAKVAIEHNRCNYLYELEVINSDDLLATLTQ